MATAPLACLAFYRRDEFGKRVERVRGRERGSGNDRGLLDRSRKAALTRIADRSNRIMAIYGVYSESSQVTVEYQVAAFTRVRSFVNVAEPNAPCYYSCVEFRRPDGNFDALRTRRDVSRRAGAEIPARDDSVSSA